MSSLSSYLLSTHKKNHAYLSDSHGYWRSTLAYNICHRVDVYRFIKRLASSSLIFLISSIPSLTILRFPPSSLMNASLGKFSKFLISSISIPSSSSASIITFSEGLSSSMKPWLFFENKTKKMKQFHRRT